jgi:hypothetical protein
VWGLLASPAIAPFLSGTPGDAAEIKEEAAKTAKHTDALSMS